MDLILSRTLLLPAAVEIAASLSHQLTRRRTPSSGAGCSAMSQFGSPSAPAPTCASQSSHEGGPRAGAMCGGSDSTPM